MFDIPTDMFYEMLIRVPTEDLVRFRCVCKAWRSLIDDYAFVKLHTRRQQGNLYILSMHLSPEEFYSVSVSSGNCSSENQVGNLKAKCLGKSICISDLGYSLDMYDRKLPIPSCDGLILFKRNDCEKRWAIYNPFLRERHDLPPCLASQLERPITKGSIGYDYIHDDYKVVFVTYCLGLLVLETSIYSLKSNQWHRIKDYPNFGSFNVYNSGVFLSGHIHWIACLKQKEGRYMYTILALDLSSENYRQLPIPSCLCDYRLSDIYLAVLGDWLFISGREKREKRLDVWIMKDYGGNNTWSKFLSLDHRVEIDGITVSFPMLVAYVKDKEKVLIVYDSLNKACWFDLVKKCMIKAPIEGRFPGAVICNQIPASLFRPSAFCEGRWLSKSPEQKEADSGHGTGGVAGGH